MLKALPTLLLIAGFSNLLPGCAEPQRPGTEITEFVPPISVVCAEGFLDGGSKVVELRDSKGQSINFCVSQGGFESIIPPHTLFVFDSGEKRTRLPLSAAEAELVVSSLQAAVDQLQPGDILPPNGIGEPFARETLRLLRTVKEIPYLDAGRTNVPAWYDEYERLKKTDSLPGCCY